MSELPRTPCPQCGSLLWWKTRGAWVCVGHEAGPPKAESCEACGQVRARWSTVDQRWVCGTPDCKMGMH